jgi:hypothetical protein
VISEDIRLKRDNLATQLHNSILEHNLDFKLETCKIVTTRKQGDHFILQSIVSTLHFVEVFENKLDLISLCTRIVNV